MLEMIKEFLRQKEIKFDFDICDGIYYDEKSNTYYLKEKVVTIRLIPRSYEKIPHGWSLFLARVRSYNPLKLRLIIRTNRDLYKYPLSISCKGIVHDIIKFPHNIEEIFLEVTTQDKKFILLDGFYVRSLSGLERVYMMLRTVLAFMGKNYVSQRKLIGLTLKDSIFKLTDAYSKANLLRDCYWNLDYSNWIRKFYTLDDKDIKFILRDIEKSKINVKLIIFILCENELIDTHKINLTLSSIKEQLYTNYNVYILTRNIANFNDIIKNIIDYKNNFVYYMFIPAGTVFYKFSFYLLAKVITKKTFDLVYTDHDFLNSKGERECPFFKPDFSLEYFRSFNYIDFAFILSSKVIKKLIDFPLDSFFHYGSYELLCRIIEDLTPTEIKHIPIPLFSFDKCYSNKVSLDESVAESYFKRHNLIADIECKENRYFKIIYINKKDRLITIIIPTKDKAVILKNCIMSIFKKTKYSSFEIIIINNKSKEKETFEFFNFLKKFKNVRIVDFNYPFNFSAMNNYAVNLARGEVLVFLNNDTEVITPEWLDVMLGFLEQPRVGAVGVKLLYPDGTVQHAGVILGPGGCSDHAFKGISHDDPGYYYRAIVNQEYLAVTGACLMTWKKLFLEVGGFDEVNLTNSFQDVDYCLKLIEAGYRIIFTPHVLLYHHESLTRKNDPILERKCKLEADFMRKKWQKYIDRDPYYNPNLNYRRPDFTLNPFPKIIKPWFESEL